jgi:hypothetical protein
MPLLEKYKWFQRGIVKAGTNERLQRFFKTNPTEEQLMILDEIDKINNVSWLLAILGYFIAGLTIGWMLWYVYPLWLKTLGI